MTLPSSAVSSSSVTDGPSTMPPQDGIASAETKVRLLCDVLETSSHLMLLCDDTGVVLYANEMARALLCVGEGDAPLGQIDQLLGPASARLVEPEITSSIEATGVWTGELTLQTSSGEMPVAVTVQMHRWDSQPQVFSVIAHDISTLKHTQARLEHQATHDPLTALTNRALFRELGDQALARANRNGTEVAVLFLDLDRFKPINDSFGHPTGDELLVKIAERLRASVRRGDLLARFGGDEFVVLCEHPVGSREMIDLAYRLIHALSEPVRVTGVTARVGVSVGIAVGAGERVTIDSLIRDADVALYRAKERNRGGAVLFDEALRSEPEVSGDIRRASRRSAPRDTD